MIDLKDNDLSYRPGNPSNDVNQSNIRLLLATYHRVSLVVMCTLAFNCHEKC